MARTPMKVAFRQTRQCSYSIGMVTLDKMNAVITGASDQRVCELDFAMAIAILATLKNYH